MSAGTPIGQLLPDWVFDRANLWNTVEESEKRKDAQVAREIEVGLPIELEDKEQVALLRDFVNREFVSNKRSPTNCGRLITGARDGAANDYGVCIRKLLFLHQRCAGGGSASIVQQGKNEMKPIVVAFLMTALSVGVARADNLTPEKIAARFFETLIKGDDAKAVDEFFSLNPLFKEKSQQVQLLKSQLGAVSQLYGAPFAIEAVSVEDLTASLQRRVYVTKHEWVAVTWEMYFYKPKDAWVPLQLLFGDQFQMIGRKK